MIRYIHNFDKNCAWGGNTFAMEVIDGKLFVGVSHCSYKDFFNKEDGRNIATSYLDEMKLHHKNNDGIECITIGDVNKHCKITGFVVNNEHFASIIFNSAPIMNHINVTINSIDYMKMGGEDLKEMLCRYYNSLISSIFDESDTSDDDAIEDAFLYVYN